MLWKYRLRNGGYLSGGRWVNESIACHWYKLACPSALLWSLYQSIPKISNVRLKAVPTGMVQFSNIQFNILRSSQIWRHFADDIFKWIFLNGNAGIVLKISLKFVPKVRVNNIPTLVQIMTPDGTKPLHEPMLTYYQSDTWEHVSLKFCSNQKLSIKVCFKWHRRQNLGHFGQLSVY